VVVVNVNKTNNMTNQEKADFYDECIRENDRLLRENSRIKSDYVGNIPPELDAQIKRNEARIALLVGKIEQMMQG
jgi:uncharacterized protein YgbK (DUF1537 family)